MKTSKRWLGLLGAAVIVSAVGVSAYNDYYSSSTGCYELWQGDGYCDSNNNNELCDYDGGDCCECTCQNDTDDDYRCGRWADFACIDPAAPCVDDDDITVDLVENCGYVQGIGNGWCDRGNNNAECGYDGGDCCSCTCVPPVNEYSWDDDYACTGDLASFACIDPDAPCVDDDDITIDVFENCDYGSIGNGYCDQGNNKPECSYDGGDCCGCTCVAEEDDDRACSHNAAGFACIDPEAPCVDDDDITVDMVENCGAAGIGDGWCNDVNNIPECNYDGGDCCECTCIAGEEFDDDYRCNELTGYACVDPAAPCVDDDGVTVDMLENCDYVQLIGNGRCNIENNTPECNYDGGDCCECTCQGDDCLEFACIDPDAECWNDDDITMDMVDECYVLGIGNGYCDDQNNNGLCGWDGGDCCQCTCDPTGRYDDDYECHQAGYWDCKDESAPCFGEEPIIIDDDTTTDDFSGTYTEDETTYEFLPWEQDGPLPTVEGAVEVGDKTEVGVTATGYDERPGGSAGMAGCGEQGGDGCEAANSRDGIASEVESRWSCATSLVEGGGPCQIEYTFAEPQNIVDIQVAFRKANERIRTLDVHLNGELTHTHESYSGSTFNTLGVVGYEVTTVMLESTGLLSDEWISLTEVLIFVQL